MTEPSQPMPRSGQGGFKYCRCGDMISVPPGGITLCPRCQDQWRQQFPPADNAETLTQQGE